MIYNPRNTRRDLKDNLISKDDIKRLLLMMTPGISKVIDKMVAPKKGLFVNKVV